jgi:hypothetical protein
MFKDQSSNSCSMTLAKRWIDYHRAIDEKGQVHLDFDTQEKYFDSSIQLDKCISQNPLLAWNLIQTIYLDCDTAILKACLAAGPLEDFLVRHGNFALEKIEKAIANDSSFRELLDGVWQNSISADVWSRIQELRKTV